VSEVSDLDQAVDEFAAAMKARLRSKAKQRWHGWRVVDREELGGRLLKNAAKGAVIGDRKSLVDVANLAMLIHRNVFDGAELPEAGARVEAIGHDWQGGAGHWMCSRCRLVSQNRPDEACPVGVAPAAKNCPGCGRESGPPCNGCFFFAADGVEGQPK